MTLRPRKLNPEARLDDDLGDGFPLEIRKVHDGTRERLFRFLVVDSPDKWVAAEKLSTVYNMQSSGSEASINFPLKGVSLTDYEKIEQANRIPQWEGEGKPTAEFKAQQDECILDQRIQLFELSIGKPIPGGSFPEKREFLNQRCEGELESLMMFMTHNLLCLSQGRLVEEFEAFDSTQSRVIEFTDWEDWSVAGESKYCFRMHRPFQDFIIEFPLRAISSSMKAQIDEEFVEPEAPMRPYRDPKTKRLDPTRQVPNLNDISWQMQKRAVHQKRIVKYFSLCMPFEIPGETARDKYDWIASHLPGDVVFIKSFIENNIIGYGSRYDFFSISSVLSS